MATRVLLVDDEESFTEVLSERLQTRGMDVSTASDGIEALKQVQGHSYDAIVLDLQMPGIDGIETMKQLLRLNPDLQVIVLTGHASVEKGVQSIREGAMEFLEKPVDIATLVQKISDAQSNRVVLTEERVSETLADILKTKGW